MTFIKTLIAAAICSLWVAAPAFAQRLDEMAWLAGRWVGEGLGGELEETWAPPAGGQMVGHFRLLREGRPVFYEIMLMDEVEDGVRMRVKHFDPGFVGWEEKDAWVEFEPRRASAEAIAFDGLSIRRIGPDEITIRIMIGYRGGVREEVLALRRAPL
jgi:hypothetical protein